MTRPLKPGLTRAEDLRAALRADGYEPNGGISSETAALDAQVCQDVRCPNCGHRGMAYEAWTNPVIRATGHGGYRALAICPDCPHGQEF